MQESTKTLVSKSLEDTKNIAKELAQKIKPGQVIHLKGDLGTGKTTFTKAFAEELGIDSFSVKSPTYTYIRKYKNIYHLDLYRIEGIDELLIQEIEEITSNPENITLIEWAEKLESFLSKKDIEIRFSYIDQNSRQIQIQEIQE